MPKRAGSSDSSDDNELVHRSSLSQKEKEVNKELRRQNKCLEQRIEVLDERNGRLQDLLHNELGKFYVYLVKTDAWASWLILEKYFNNADRQNIPGDRHMLPLAYHTLPM